MQKWWKKRKRRENSGHWFCCHFGTYFGALPRVHFIHTIYCFEAREVSSPTLQTVSKSELKRKSYGHCKKTGPSWAGVSHTSIQGGKIFAPCETTSWHTSAISHTSSQISHGANQGVKILLLLDTLLEHFPKSIFDILYTISKLGKSEIQFFKRCMIWIWNKEVMVVWSRLCKAEMEMLQPHQIFLLLTRFWSTSWSSKYAFHISF